MHENTFFSILDVSAINMIFILIKIMFKITCGNLIILGRYGSAKSEAIILEVSTAVDKGQVCISGKT